MFLALALACMTQFPVIVEQPAVVGYELQTMTYQQYVPVVRTAPRVLAAPVVTYSLPGAYYMEVAPVVRGYPLLMGGRTVIKDRWPGFRGRTVLRY